MTPRTNILETYLAEIARIRATGAGVEETSYYAPLAEALNEVGRGLRPKVQCVMQLANQGAGLPDGGLFTAEQCQKSDLVTPLPGQIPARGVIEVKGPGYDLEKLIGSDQIARYWKSYRLVLVTNYRAFALIGTGPDGNPKLLERFVLAEDEASFWALAHHPKTAQKKLGAPFVEYLRRIMLHNAPLAAPRDVAGILASYAKDALARVENADTPALESLRIALSEALGLRFEGDKGEHFFRSTLVQTLFYGLFSAWVMWSRAGHRDADTPFPELLRDAASPYGPRPAQFEWDSAKCSLRLPVIRVLFEQVATPSKLGPLGLVEVLNWAAAALGRVDEAAFFKSFDEDNAVQYFYEPFLEAFDPALRKDLGVWYTPEEIVAYQVARVDTVLREELDIPDGLADPNVYVLDPCCGTGAYLRFVLAKIEETLRAKGGDALVANDLKRAAMDRVFGFEILPAPFVIAHLQLGLLLQKLGAPLSEAKSERVGVYLSNALEGWEPPAHEKEPLIFKEFEEERDASDKVKRATPILVVLGNPPYNAYAGTSPEEEQGLVDPYKAGLIKEWGIKKFNLDDLYVRFFRIAENRIAEGTRRGVVSFISNFSYISDPSFVVMRQRLLTGFDKIWIDCLNGDSRETGKLTPDGKPDPSVFSTERNREGIRVGTAIGMFVKKGSTHEPNTSVAFRQFWGTKKRIELLASSETPDINAQYETSAPSKENRFSFRPVTVGSAYQTWPRVVDLCATPPSNGLMEKRGGALFDIDRDALIRRMKRYFDSGVSWTVLKAEHHPLTADAARFPAESARLKVLAAESFLESRILRYALRPFDVRWCYYSGIRPLWNEPRPSHFAKLTPEAFFFVTRPAGVANPEGVPVHYTCMLGDNDFQRGHSYYFPSLIHTQLLGQHLIHSNLSLWARSLLANFALPDPDSDRSIAEVVWLHALAICCSPVYLSENADGIRQNWPRIPFPTKCEPLLASVELGKRIASLHDTEVHVPGVTGGSIDLSFRELGAIQKVDGMQIDPSSGDLDVTVGWSHAGRAGIVMPGRGRITERGDLLDIWLNERVYWKNVPRLVWEYTIGGYQVIKKWLSYREKASLGRSLTPEEARYVTEMVRRLAALIAMQPDLDANYQLVRSDTIPFKGE